MTIKSIWPYRLLLFGKNVLHIIGAGCIGAGIPIHSHFTTMEVCFLMGGIILVYVSFWCLRRVRHLQHTRKWPDMDNPVIERKKQKRERLDILAHIDTNSARYLVYETQTVKDDAVNIEIERRDNLSGSVQIILESEISNDSWGGMCGDAFSSLIIDATNHLSSYIKLRSEIIIYEKQMWRTKR